MSPLCLFSTIVLLLLQYMYFITSCSSSSSFSDTIFENWVKEHGKTYNSMQEKQYRIRVFKENYDYITTQHNNYSSSYTLSLNVFADLTHHEFKTKYLLGWPHHLSVASTDNILESSSTHVLEDVVQPPVRVGICANDRSFQFYSRGIFTGPCCDTFDHSVLVEGYNDDTKDGVEYWNVKNSWGANWGINGYMHIARWDGNNNNSLSSCGINRQLYMMMMNYLDKSTSPNSLLPSPLASPPPPNSSLSRSECFPLTCTSGGTCCCHKRILFMCQKASCCQSDFPICCKVNHSCCSEDHPICIPGIKDQCFEKNGTDSILANLMGNATLRA